MPERRSGVVLLAVLIVLVLLSLAAYNYSDLMQSEYKASDNFHKNAQARAFADAGIHYAMAVLSTSDNVSSFLNNNPYSNSGVFQNHSVTQGNSNGQGFFTLIAPNNPTTNSGTGTCQYGVIDESSKININAMMVIDSTGNKLYQMLLLLPNMTDDIANSIIDWVDTDTTPRQGGAESDYYGGLSPPYSSKDGPMDSIDEMLLIKGVTPQLLYGIDLNRNGIQDPDEVDNGSSATTGFDRGWSAFLTIYSREQNVDASGLALTNLNDSTVDLATMYGTLSTNLSDDLGKFIIMYRQYNSSGGSSSGNTPGSPTGKGGSGASAGPSAAAGPSAFAGAGASAKGGASAGAGAFAGGGARAGASASAGPSAGVGSGAMKGPTTAAAVQYGTLASFTLDTTKAANYTIKSLYELINATVSIPNTTNPRAAPTVYKSPLSDPNQQADLLPKLFQTSTIFPGAEIPARINMNTAPMEVISTLVGVGTSATNTLSTTDIQAIIAAQPTYSSGDAPQDIYQTPAWLVTQANITPAKLIPLEPLITAKTQVYRVQSLGYFDQTKGPVSRVEAVIDTNGGQPRILTWRDMGDFGKVRPPQN